MQNLNCEHCGGKVIVGDNNCSHCGMPLAPDFGRSPQKKFKLYFIVLIIICAGMIIWLPPDWTRFIK